MIPHLKIRIRILTLSPGLGYSKGIPYKRLEGRSVRFLEYSAGLMVILIVILFLFGGASTGWSDADDNQCIDCHTSPRKLITITREIAKTAKKPAVSLETVGEG